MKDRITNKVRYFNRFNQQSVTYQGKLVDNLHKDGAIEKYANLLEYYQGDKETVVEEIESTLRIANMHIEDAKRKIEAYGGNSFYQMIKKHLFAWIGTGKTETGWLQHI